MLGLKPTDHVPNDVIVLHKDPGLVLRLFDKYGVLQGEAYTYFKSIFNSGAANYVLTLVCPSQKRQLLFLSFDDHKLINIFKIAHDAKLKNPEVIVILFSDDKISLPEGSEVDAVIRIPKCESVDAIPEKDASIPSDLVKAFLDGYPKDDLVAITRRAL